jgi:hypothetical protein
LSKSGRIKHSIFKDFSAFTLHPRKKLKIQGLSDFVGFCVVGAGFVPALLWATIRDCPYTPSIPKETKFNNQGGNPIQR